VAPLHVAVPFVGVGQDVGGQFDPQLATLLFATQAPPHRWYPSLQVNPHVVPLHVAMAFAGGTQGEHDVPQLLTPPFDAHVEPQG
jgi:hypothetical protein